MTTTPRTGPDKEATTFHTLVRLLRRGWVVIVVTLLAGGGVGVAVNLTVTPQYRASTSMYVSVKGTSNSAELAQGGSAAEQKVQTFANVARSAIVLEPVIEQLHLDTEVAELAGRVEAQSPIDSVLVTVAVTDTSARRAAETANAIATQLGRVVTERLEKPNADGESPFVIETVQPAGVPDAPASPRLAVNVTGGLLVGLLLGFALAALRVAFDVRIEDREEVERITGAPAIGSIAYDRVVQERPLVVHADSADPRSEEFRRLRTNLQFLEVGRPTRSFVVTSSIKGEGKSTTAANLAIALAQNGERVALVDGDLRRPRLAQLMGLEGSAGLTDVLIGRMELSDALHQWGRDELVVLPSGQIPPNPVELLGTEAMRRVLAELEESYDVVIVDAPPLLPVIDAAVLSRIAGGTLLVASMTKTSREQLRGAVAALADSGASAVGSVMTMVKGERGNRYDYAYSYRQDADPVPPAPLVEPEPVGRHVVRAPRGALGS